MNNPYSDRIAGIIDAVCQLYGISKEAFFSRSLARALSEARHLAICLAYNTCNLSLAELGECFDKTYDSVYYAINHARDLLKFDKHFQRQYNELKRMLKL